MANRDTAPGQECAQGPTAGLNARRKARKAWEGAAAYGLLAEPEPVTAADTDLDSRITKAEFLEAAERRFKLLDKRKDGKLTPDELPMTASQAGGRGRQDQGSAGSLPPAQPAASRPMRRARR